MTSDPHHPALHRLALLTAAATFPLIFMGGLVTSHGAGMSVPDWPNSYGYNMFTFPPSKWIGGIFYEHTHRLMGTVVGMLSIALTVVAWRTEPRRWVRWLATGVLGAVIFQGVLGGLRVVTVELDLAIVHACFAQAFFCLAALTAVVTSRWWQAQGDADRPVVAWASRPSFSSERWGETPKPREEVELESATRLTRIALAAVVLIYLQLIAGAVMRHYEAGLAIPDFPTSYGHVLPPATPEQLADANARRAFAMQLPPVTQAQVWLHFAHRIGAVLVSVAIIAAVTLALQHFRGRVSWELVSGAFLAAAAGLAALGAAGAIGSKSGWVAGISMLSLATIAAFILRAFFRRMGEARPILAPAILSAALLLAQITLGILTVLLRKPADIASAHVAVGALTLVSAFVLTARAWRLKAVSSASCEAAGAARASDDEVTQDFTREPVLAA